MSVNYKKPIIIRDFRNGSWFWVQTHVWRDKKLSKSDKLVYGTIASYSNQEQYAFPSIDTIAHDADISPRQVYYSVRQLEKVNYLAVQRRNGRPNIYTLLKTTPATSAPLQPVQGRGAKSHRGTISINNNINPDSENRVENGNSFKKKCPNTLDGHRGCIEFITSFAESRGIKFPIFGKQINALHKMLSVGITFDAINKQIDKMEADRFWSQKGFDLMNVANEIGKGGKDG